MQKYFFMFLLACLCGDCSADWFKRPPPQVNSEQILKPPERLSKSLIVISIHESILKPELIDKAVTEKLSKSGIVTETVVREIFEETDTVKAAWDIFHPEQVLTIKQTGTSNSSGIFFFDISVTLYDVGKSMLVWRAWTTIRSRGHFMSQEEYYKEVASEFCDALLEKMKADGLIP